MIKDWKQQLAGLGGHPSKKSLDPPPPAEAASSFRSANVDSSERAGRAPYNFVPLPAKIRWWSEPPDADRYHEDLLSGEIEIRLEALTDFYVRGMWSLAEFLTKLNGQEREIKHQTLPFLVDGKLRLPGSSLRGMIRTLVEILGSSPLDPISDQQLFFRAVGASGKPTDRSFDPNATAYKDRISPGSGTESDPAFPAVKVGFLYAKRDGWEIHPAETGPDGAQWYRIEDRGPAEKPQLVHFQPAMKETDHYHNHPETWYRFGTVSSTRMARATDPVPAGFRKGWLVRSGSVGRNKYLQWIIHDEKRPPVESEIVPLEREDVTAYLEDKNSAAHIKYDRKTQGAPCFYKKWEDAEGRPHVSFGPTPHFRLPYRTTTRMANPSRRGKAEVNWDLAQAVFGRTPDRNRPGKKGRVCFEDAFSEAGEEACNPRNDTVVLGTPKPTTYQHYLVQPSDRIEEAIHWDGTYDAQPGKKAVVRGHKLYWHRGAMPLRQASPEQSRVASVFRRVCRPAAGNGIQFVAKIRYENLCPKELGALLTALELPQDCAHHLGMGKPLGLGSFRIDITAVREILRKNRYSRLFSPAPQDEKVVWETGVAAPASVERIRDLKQAFARWCLNLADEAPVANDLWKEIGKTDPARSEEEVRLREFYALLQYEKPAGLSWEQWQRATRYLEFGYVFPNRQQPFNEYLNGYSVSNGQIRAEPNGRRRRPLPPASQVREAGRNIPKDPAPDVLAKESGIQPQPRDGGDRHGPPRGGGRR